MWALTGLWHGAAWNFVLWGLLYAVLLILEKTLSRYFGAKIPNLVKRIYTLFFVTVGFVLFDALSLGDAATRIGGMFGIGVSAFTGENTRYLIRNYGFVILLSAFCALDIAKRAVMKWIEKPNRRALLMWGEPIFLLVLFVISLAFVIDSSFNPFIYFRF